MKKIRTLLLLTLCLALAGCQNITAPSEVDLIPVETAADAIVSTPAPEASPSGEMPSAPVSDVTMGDGEIAGLLELDAQYVSSRALFPEGATEETAEYALSVTLPTFPAAPQDMANVLATLQNAAEVLSDEALSRVTDERLPLSDRADGASVPETKLVVKAYSALNGEFFELVALETWTYLGSDRTERLSASVFTGEGVELSLNDLVGGYSARDIAAQQVYNVIDREDGAFYNDISLEDIALGMDTYNGFVVTDGGVVILFAPGAIAPEEALTQRVQIKRAALWPDGVNDAINGGLFTEAEYASLIGALRAVACAVAPNYESFEASSPSAYAATAFMTRMLTDADCASCSPIPFKTVEKSEYERVYAGYFTAKAPDIKGEAPITDGTVLSDDGAIYNVPLATLDDYAFRPESCSLDGGALILSGALVSGLQSDDAQSVMAVMSVRLIKNASAANGFYIDAVTLD